MFRPTRDRAIGACPSKVYEEERENPMRTHVFAAAMLLAPAAASASSLTDFLVVTSGNLNARSQIDGTTLVGGNLQTTGWPSFGGHLAGSGAPSSVETLTVAGSAAGDLHLQYGTMRVGGARSGNTNFNGGSTFVAEDFNSINARVASVVADLNSASAGYAAMSANSSIVNPGGNNYTFQATPDANGFAVFSITNALFSNPNADFGISGVGSDDTVVINVLGSTVNFNHNLTGAFSSLRRQIVWNFVEATEVTIGRRFDGTVLAMNAGVTTHQDIDGGLYAANATLNGQVHLIPFGGGTPPETVVIPLPSGAAMGALGLALVGVRRRR